MAASNGRDTAAQVFDYIIHHMRQSCGVPPTVREIQSELDISSTSMVAFYLDKLAAAGLIERAAGESRGIRVPGARWEYTAAGDDEPEDDEYIDDWDILRAIRLGRGCGSRT